MQGSFARCRRREVLSGLLGLAGAAAAPRAPAEAIALPDIPSAPIQRPEPGLVEVTLEAKPARVAVAGRPAALWTYNGVLPGPLIEARAGDTIRLRFTNRSSGTYQPPLPRAARHAGGQRRQHLAEHRPGDDFAYEVALPANEGGLFWYHPHPHHRLAHQLWQGLAGPLVIRTPIDALPELVDADERVIMLRDLALADGVPEPHDRRDWNPGKTGDLLLVNGVVRPVLEAQSGLLWLRLINAANARYLLLALADGRPFHLIATDGRFLEQPVPHTDLLLAPANRADILVQLGPGQPVQLVHKPYNRGSRREPPRPSRCSRSCHRPMPARFHYPLASPRSRDCHLTLRRGGASSRWPCRRCAPRRPTSAGRRSARASARSSCGRWSTRTRWITPSTSTPGIFRF